jgi:hypothetical protein
MVKRGVFRAALWAAFACSLFSTGCATPGNPDNGDPEWSGDPEPVDDVPRAEPEVRSFDADELVGLRLAAGENVRGFDRGELRFEKPFDRIGLLWDATENGGSASVEVSPDGVTWTPAIVTSKEIVADTGVTLYSGHADLPAGSTALQWRVSLTAGTSLVSPVVNAVQIEAFVLGDVEEISTASTGLGPLDVEVEGDDVGTVLADPADAGEEAALTSAASFTNSDIVSRSDWGAKPEKCTPAKQDPRYITFHHTATPNGETGAAARARMRQLQDHDINTLGFCDIGFHFVVDANGKVYRGRTSAARIGNHVPGHNRNNVGIALMGKFSSVAPGAAQLKGLMNIAALIADRYDIPANKNRFRGHREYSNAGTGCPGAKAFAKKGAILEGMRFRLRDRGPRVSDFVANSCSTVTVRPLAEELITELNCTNSGTIRRIPHDSHIALGSAAFPFDQAAPAKSLPHVVDSRPGHTLVVASALRTLPQQYLLYHWFEDHRCGIKLAAKPGTSNHERGTALDISDEAGWKAAMNAHHWRWFGSLDPVHFDYVGGGTVSLSGRSVKAFQRLWNLNHPGDMISVDGVFGNGTSARLRKSPAHGFAIYSSCGGPEMVPHDYVLEQPEAETCGM